MYERLKQLKFYHPDDEAGELFQATCALAYKMNAFDNQKAELLYTWAKEQAEESRKWSEKQGLNLEDFVTGVSSC